ncbi:MAG: hypothetical protein WCB01_13080 [Candidatus Cybelea sp.]
MLRLRKLVACAVVMACLQAGTARAMTIDRCTVVAAEMMDNVDSSDARPGDFFRFQTVNAVTDGTRVVIPARTLGYGIVTLAVPAARDARPGTLVLEPRYLMLPDGQRLGVVLNHNTASLDESGASSGIPGYLGAIPVLGVGAAIGLFNYFHKGKNVVVRRGTVFTFFPSDDPSVERCQDHPSY